MKNVRHVRFDENISSYNILLNADKVITFGSTIVFEADYLKKPIIASERDYVRDLINPIFTFDPNSSLSIARAVARHQGIKKPNNYPKNSTFFIKKLFEIK